MFFAGRGAAWRTVTVRAYFFFSVLPACILCSALRAFMLRFISRQIFYFSSLLYSSFFCTANFVLSSCCIACCPNSTCTTFFSRCKCRRYVGLPCVSLNSLFIAPVVVVHYVLDRPQCVGHPMSMIHEVF